MAKETNEDMVTRQFTIQDTNDASSLQTYAINNIQFIRDTMERASSFTAVPGWGMVAMGTSAFVAAYIASTRSSLNEWLLIWLVDAFIAIIIGSVAMVYKSYKADDTLFSKAGWRFILNLFVPIVAGIPITMVFYQQDLIHYLPGLWLLLYGTGVVTGGAFSVRVIPIMGFCYIVIGTYTLFASPAWGNYLLAIGFGGIHIIFGLIVARRHGG
jgi:hypothetical protein